MGMGRNLGNRESVRLFAPALAESVTAADVDWRPCAQVGQRKVHASIAAKGRPEQREESLVLVN